MKNGMIKGVYVIFIVPEFSNRLTENEESFVVSQIMLLEDFLALLRELTAASLTYDNVKNFFRNEKRKLILRQMIGILYACNALFFTDEQYNGLFLFLMLSDITDIGLICSNQRTLRLNNPAV